MPSKKETKSKFLVIVESPAKSKTINKILGKDYKVLASMGHIIDLPRGRMGIDFENNFKPEYTVIKGRKRYLTDLKKSAGDAEVIFLAADPDREGEAICWHLKTQFVKDKADIYRVRFEELTPSAVKAAFDHPGAIDMNKVNAQQARRLLDRIVGYSLSPLLWSKVTKGLSAGRVQSVAVMLIVKREEEIRAFKPEEYWSLEALLKKKDINVSSDEDKVKFKAKLIKYNGEKIHVSDKEKADKIIAELENERFIAGSINRKEKKSYPRSPYTTSLLQQDAFNKLNFSASKTMRVAQTLYEGVELGKDGSEGLITYMRTDSVRVSKEAQDDAKEYILNTYGEKYCPPKLCVYKAQKGAQEAHEAIRPTLPLRPPDEVSKYLNSDEVRLYQLIWKRFIASQMANAIFSVLTVNIDAGLYRFRAGGSLPIFDGFLRVYKIDELKEPGMEKIPHLEIGEILDMEGFLPEQHFTKAPARYTDASLVKDLEEKGIGRPSTYAPIIRTIISRNYIKRVTRTLEPTELGELVNKLLLDNFPDVVDERFTAKMEASLDNIEDGKEEWVGVLKNFYDSFAQKLEIAKEKMRSVKRQSIATDQVCEKCGEPMVIKWGRKGRFLSCSAFPACKNAKSITTGVKCPEPNCGGELVERRSKRGIFYGCTNYPKCTHIAKKLPGLDNQEEPIEEEENNI